MRDYSSIISNATNSYNAALAGYKTTLAQQQQQQQGVISGYNALQNTVLGGLEGASAAQKQDIAEQYKVAGDKNVSDMIGKGLYNSSLASSYGTRLNLDQARAQNDRANKFAMTAADKTTQLGLAGLNYQGQALNSNMQFAGQGLNYAGQGAYQIGNLAQGVAGLEQQGNYQDAQLAQQSKQFSQQMALENRKLMLQQYGVGGGGSGGYAPNLGGTPYGGNNNSGWTSYGGYGGNAQSYVPNPSYSQQGGTYNGDPIYPAAAAASPQGSGFFGLDNPWYGGSAIPDDGSGE